MGKIYEKLVGTVSLELCGTLPESFLNACAMQGLELWELKCVDQYTLHIRAFESDLKELERIAEKCMCTLKLIETLGGSKNHRFLRRRMWLMLCILIASAVLILSSLFIWEIDVRGNEKVSTATILRELSSCGVREGCFWPNISAEEVRSSIMTKIPELGWMTVNISGSRAIVLINERQEKPEIYDESLPTNILAKQSGIIRKASIMNGSSQVQPNQTVAKGQLLVSSAMESIGGELRYVCSRASILADTCHEIRMVYPTQSRIKGEVQKTSSRFALKFGKNRINLYLRARNNIDECDKIISEYKLGIAGLFALPLSVIKEELVRCEKEEKAADLTELLCKQHIEKLRERISGSIEYSSHNTYETEKLSYVNLYVQCYEDIAQSLIISP